MVCLHKSLFSWESPFQLLWKEAQTDFQATWSMLGTSPNLWLALAFLKQLTHSSWYPEPPWVNWSPAYHRLFQLLVRKRCCNHSVPKQVLGTLRSLLKHLLWCSFSGCFWFFHILLLNTLLGISITPFAANAIVLRVFVRYFVWRGETWCNLICVGQALLSWGKEGSIAMRFLFTVWSPYVIVAGQYSFLRYYLNLTNHIFLALSSSFVFFLSVSLTFIASKKTSAMLLQPWTSAVVHCHQSPWKPLPVCQQSSTVKN